MILLYLYSVLDVAAIREANIDKVYVDIIKHFMSFDGRIVRKLVVCIRPKDYLDEKVDLKRIEKYLDFRSSFNEKYCFSNI